MKMGKLILSAAALIAFCVPPVFAHQTIARRKVNQQHRIAQGAKSGQLTRGETHRLERQQRSINRESKAMRHANGGKLTPKDKKVLTRRQNRASANIYAKKHNARTRH